MIRVSAHAAALWAIVTVTASAMAFPAFSQAPTDAQRSAIRSACRSDYVAHCSSVPPGGMASLQCLQKNMSSLSSSCKAAVNAIEAPAEPKADAKPETKPDAKPEAAPAASTAAPAEKPCRRNRAGTCTEGGGEHGGQKAEQCAGGRDPQRLPFRLHGALRQRADRRRRGAELPEAEQIKSLGELPASRQCGRRRCGVR